MSSMLNQQHIFTKLRVKLEGRDRRKCWSCKKFGHLVHNYRNKNEKEKKKLIPRNKFEVLSSKVMRYRVKEEVRIRRNKTVEEVRCFRYWSIEHFKQEDSNIEVKKKRKRNKEVIYMASLQKTQQEERPVYFLQRKIQEYSSIWGMLPKSAILEQREQMTRWEVVTFVECGEYNYKGTKMYENQGQGFISGEYLRNVQCSSCLEA